LRPRRRRPSLDADGRGEARRAGSRSVVRQARPRARSARARRAPLARAESREAHADGRAAAGSTAGRPRTRGPPPRAGTRTAPAGAGARGRAEAGGARELGRQAGGVVTVANTPARIRGRPDGLPASLLERGRHAGRPGRRHARGGRLRRARRRGGAVSTPEEPTFEQAQTELEQIVERLERGQVPLDEALTLWERGEQLYAFCRGKLDAAQGKVEELARRAAEAAPPDPSWLAAAPSAVRTSPEPASPSSGSSACAADGMTRSIAKDSPSRARKRTPTPIPTDASIACSPNPYATPTSYETP